MTSDPLKKSGRNQEEGASEETMNTGMGQQFPNNGDSVDFLESIKQFLSQQWANGDTNAIEGLINFLQEREKVNVNSQGATNNSTQGRKPQINYNINIPPNQIITDPCATFAERNANIETLPVFEGSSEEWRRYLVGYEAIALKGTDPDSHRVILELGKKLTGITKIAFDKLYKHGQKYSEIT
ncbi:unnamed protein product, partial [Rotaria socialis]